MCSPGIMHARPRYATEELAKATVVYGRGMPLSAGVDISEFGGAAFDSPALPHLLIELAASSKPVVAAVGGLAMGGGLVQAMACGYRISEPKAHLGLPEITLSLLHGACGTQRLPRLIGAETTLETILSGQPMCAERALELGVADRLAAAVDDLLDAARAYAREGMQT